MNDRGTDAFGKGIAKLRVVASRTKPDWEKVERDYRAGVLSIREIARLNDLSDGAIRLKAKARGWERDLTARVAEKVRIELLRTELRATQTPERLRSDAQVVSESAATRVDVVLSARRRISRVCSIVDALTAQLKDVVDRREEIERDIIGDTAGTADADRRRRMLGAVSLGANVATAKNLALALQTLVGLERQAFGMSDTDDGAPPVRDDDGERRAEHARGVALEDRMREALARR